MSIGEIHDPGKTADRISGSVTKITRRASQAGYRTPAGGAIVLADEVSRRDHERLELRLRQAGFEQLCRLEDFDWSAQVRLDRRLLDAACSLQFLDRREHVLLVGPVGVGKSFLAQALGYAAVRSGHSVRFVSADQYFRELAQARVDHTAEKAFRRWHESRSPPQRGYFPSRHGLTWWPKRTAQASRER